MKTLITGGLGDFLAIEVRLAESFRRNVEKIYLATPAEKSIREILKLHEFWDKIPVETALTREQINAHSRWQHCVHSIDEVNQILRKLKTRVQLASDVQDLSIVRLFPLFDKGEFQPSKSLFNFPTMKFDGILFDAQTTSGDMRIKNRNFTFPEISAVYEHANLYNKKIMAVGEGITSLIDAIAYAHGARKFLGVDSALSVAANNARLEGVKNKMFVRSVNPVWRKHKAHWYVDPSFFDFTEVRENLETIFED